MVRELNEHPEADLIYSDEDKITEDGVRHYPHFKSDWNPELMLCQNYVCHFTVVRRTIFEKLDGIRKGFDGAQDWDFVLRVSESTTPDKIRHIAKILYHWRVIDGSTAKATESKPYVTAAQIKAVSEHLERIGDTGARVESLPAISMLRVTYQIPTPPLVSLIIPTHNQVKLLSSCIHGILESTTYKNVEVLVVDNRSDDPQTLRYLEEVSQDSRVRVIRDDGEFNFARINNDAVKHARGTVLGFINNDIQVVRPDWLREMVSHVIRPNVGAVGARLLYPNGTVQHAGVILGIGGVADHMMKHISAQSLGYFCRAILPQNLSAVTAACMLVKREAFEQVGGFDQDAFAVAYNDIDFCLRLRQAGYLITYTPYAELLHHESISRG
jgi:GT2 family glycosyltransferase